MNQKLTKLTLAADPGNYEIKFWDGSTTRAIRAVYFQLPKGRQPLGGKPNSPVIEYQGRTWHWGVKAYEYRKQSHIVEGDKSKEILLSIMACCDFSLKEYALDIRMSHPMSELVSEEIQKQLLGCHVFSRNGRKAIAHIEEVIVEPEGLGAWRYAKKQGLIPAQGYVVVIDIGGGTWISRLFNPEGDIIDSSVDSKGGAYDLATSISFDERLVKVLRTRPQPGVIMDGFANGTHHYGEMSNASWSPWLSDHLNPWFKGIINAVKTQYEPQRSRIVKFILTGGSSLLIADKVQNLENLVVVPEPRFANVLGLGLASEPEEVIEAA